MLACLCPRMVVWVSELIQVNLEINVMNQDDENGK